MDLRKDPDSYWYHVPHDIWDLVKRYVSNIDSYPTLPPRGSRGPKLNYRRLQLTSRVVLYGQHGYTEWLWPMDLDRQNRLILREIETVTLVAYHVNEKRFVETPITSWERLINQSQADNSNPARISSNIHSITANCTNIFDQLNDSSRLEEQHRPNASIERISYQYYLDGCGQVIQIRSNANFQEELYIYPVVAGEDLALIPPDLPPVFVDSQVIYPFQDPVSLTMYFYIYGKVYRYQAGRLQLILRTHLRNFRHAWINLQGQMILVHGAFNKKVDHLAHIKNPFVPTAQPSLIVSVYQ